MTMVNVPPGWTSIAAIAKSAPATRQRWSEPMRLWLKETVMKPDPRLGRRGAVCPFVATAVDEDVLWFSECSVDGDDRRSLSRDLSWHAELFRKATKPLPTARRQTTAVVVVYPHIMIDKAAVLSEVRRETKPALLAEGLTCGEFYPMSDDRSARNTEMRIACSPVPCIAVRYLTNHDELFLRTQPALFEYFVRWQRNTDDEVR
jgi:hypothetical protein